MNKGYSSSLGVFRYEITNEAVFGRRIRLYMGKLLCTFDKTHGAATVPYPIAVDVYCDKGVIVARAKSKAGLYKYQEEFLLERAIATKSEKETAAAIKWVLEKFALSTKKSLEARTVFRAQLYGMKRIQRLNRRQHRKKQWRKGKMYQIWDNHFQKKGTFNF